MAFSWIEPANFLRIVPSAALAGFVGAHQFAQFRNCVVLLQNHEKQGP